MRRRTLPAVWLWAFLLICVAIVVAVAWRPMTAPVDVQLPTLVVTP